MRNIAIHPGRRPLMRMVVRLVLFILGKSFASMSGFQKDVMKEVSSWPEVFAFEMRVEPFGPSIFLVKHNGKLNYKSDYSGKPDLVISFKNLKSAYLLLTARMSTIRGYCEKRMSVRGEIVIATSIIRCMNTIETYLFPEIIARVVVKRVPRISFVRKTTGRIRLVAIGLIFGR